MENHVKRCFLCGAEVQFSLSAAVGHQRALCPQCANKITSILPDGEYPAIRLDEERSHHCSFCGRSASHARWIVVAEWAAICDACIWKCVELVAAAYKEQAAGHRDETPRPSPTDDDDDDDDDEDAA